MTSWEVIFMLNSSAGSAVSGTAAFTARSQVGILKQLQGRASTRKLATLTLLCHRCHLGILLAPDADSQAEAITEKVRNG